MNVKEAVAYLKHLRLDLVSLPAKGSKLTGRVAINPEMREKCAEAIEVVLREVASYVVLVHRLDPLEREMSLLVRAHAKVGE